MTAVSIPGPEVSAVSTKTGKFTAPWYDTMRRLSEETVDSFNSTFNVRDYGAKGNGTTDDTASIQAAIDAAGANGGGTVFIPKGSYLLSDTLTISFSNVQLVGESSSLSALIRSSDYGDTILVTGDTGTGTPIYFNRIKSLSITSTGSVTGGYHINLTCLTNPIIDDIFITNGFSGIILQGVATAIIKNVFSQWYDIYGGSTSGRYGFVSFPGPATMSYRNNVAFCDRVAIGCVVGSGALQHGAFILCSDGLWFDQCYFGYCNDYDFLIEHDQSLNMVGIQITGCWFDGYGYGIGLIASDASQCRELLVANSLIIGQGLGAIGVYASSSFDGHHIVFSGCSFTGWNNDGVRIETGTTTTDWNFSGCQFYDNGDYGIQMLSGSHYVINGGRSGSASQIYGVHIGVGVDYVLVTNMDLSRNGTGGVLNSSAGANITIANNI